MTDVWTLLTLPGLAIVAAAWVTLRNRRVRRLSGSADSVVPGDDALGWGAPDSPVLLTFETPEFDTRRAAESPPVPLADRWGRAASVLDGSLMAASFVEAGLTIDPTVIDALERWVHHGDAFGGGDVFSYLHAHHDAIFSASSHEGFQHALSGFVGEQIAATELAASGHDVVLPIATNVPAWDMQIDGHLFQVKTGITSLAQAQASTAAHPDIGIISSPDVADHFSNSIGLPDLNADHLASTTSHSLHALDTLGSAGAIHIPIITAIRSSWREFALLDRDATTLADAAKNLSLDLAGTGLGAAGGAKAGALIGTFFGPGIGTAIGAAVGAIGGAIVGRLGSDHVKHLPYRNAAEEWEIARASSDAAVQAVAMRTQQDLRRYVDARDAEVRTALFQERKRLDALLAAERVHAAADLAGAVTAFLALLDQLEREVDRGLEAFEIAQRFNRVRAAFWPAVGDVAVLRARSWAKASRLRLAAARSQINAVQPQPGAHTEITKIVRTFFEAYRFEANDFMQATNAIRKRGLARLVRVEDTAANASRRFREMLARVQREINATIDAAYVSFSREAQTLWAPAIAAQTTLAKEAAKLGLEH